MIDFNWLKKVELVEMKYCHFKEDPVRPELDNKFRKDWGRKIFGLQYKDEIQGVICVAYTDEIPTTVKELDLMSNENGTIAIAYTVWSLKKGAGKTIMEVLLKYMKDKGNIETIMTLSPLTPMATHYHIRNGARLININPTTQNFEYKL